MALSSNPLELTLSLKPSYVPKSLPDLFSGLASIDNVPKKLSVLNDYLQQHQEELSKVEKLKSDLPQCVLLLLDAIKELKDEISKLSGQQSADACIKKTSDDHQLEGRSAFQTYKSSSPPFNPKLFNTDHTSTAGDDQGITKVTFQQLGSCSGGGKGEETMYLTTAFPCDLNMEASDSEPEQEPQPQPQPLPIWKNSRRSWTAELHTRFVEAMSLLGGPETATPKQIREQMQVKGLTNDQVKSHLQKYRLNSRGVAAANTDQRTLPFIYRDFWNSSNHSNSQQQQKQQQQGARTAGAGSGGGSLSGGRGRESSENKRPKKSRLGDA